MKFLKNFFNKFKTKGEFNSQCYLRVDIDDNNNYWIDWGWTDGNTSLLGFCKMLAQLNQGMLLDDILLTIKKKCELDDKHDDYTVLLDILGNVYAEINSATTKEVEEMSKHLSSPLIKPTQVMSND